MLLPFEWSPPSGRPHQRDLRRGVRAFAEGAFAVGEIEVPEALEASVEAERRDAIEACQEVIPPVPQRLGVVRRDVLEAQELEIREIRAVGADWRIIAVPKRPA